MSRRSFAVIPLVVALGGALLGIGGPSMADQPRALPAAMTTASATGSWSAMSAGLNGEVLDILLAANGDVYVGGAFTPAGDIDDTALAMWDPRTRQWSGIGGGASAAVSALALDDDMLYVGGDFTMVGGSTSANRIAAWNGSHWSSLGSGADNEVISLIVDDDTLFVGGLFTGVGGLPGTQGIAAWSDDTWHSLDGGITVPGTGVTGVLAMTAYDGLLFAGGRFRRMGTDGTDDTDIAQWNPATRQWSPLGSGVFNPASNVSVYGLSSGDDSIFAAGNFTTAGSLSTTGIAAWDGVDWGPVGGGVSGDCGSGNYVTVQATEFDERRSLLYVGGNFCRAGDDTVNLISAWDVGISEWIPFRTADDSLGIPVGGRVQALARAGTSVYVGGRITDAGGLPGADNIVEWTWEPPSGSNVLSGVPGDTVSLSGERFIGVPSSGGITFGGIPSPGYIRDDTTSFSNVIVPAGVYGTVPIEVDAVGGRALVGTFSAPAQPSGAPRDLTVVAGDASATVSWSPPMSSGSFPVSNYQVLASPSGRSCVTATLTCEVTGLPNGVEQSVRVRALTGAGWGAWSEPASVTPVARAIRISGTRDGRRISLAGQATGFGMGAIVSVWIDAGRGYRQMRRTALVSIDGQFEWAKRLKRNVAVRVYVTIGEVRSNRIRLG